MLKVKVLQNFGFNKYDSLKKAKFLQNDKKPKMDYSTIKNENCGKTREIKMKAIDVILENIQDQASLFVFQPTKKSKPG